MPSQSEMKAVLQRYIDGFNAEDPRAIAELFADDATVEDPVGSEPIRGREAIAEFYREAVATGAKLTLETPVRGSQADYAAMAFSIDLEYEGQPTRIRAIDVMRIDESGRIASMQAFWGPEDVEPR